MVPFTKRPQEWFWIGKLVGFSFECGMFEVTVVQHPKTVLEVVIASVGYMGGL